MRSILRVGMVVASLAGLAGTLAPTPAEAQTVGSITFTGTATMGNHGIAYPTFGSTGTPGDLSKTPVLDHDGENSATVTFNSGPCVAEGTTTKKALPVEAGTCAIQAAGTMHGYCDLSVGHLTGSMSVFSLIGPSQHYSFSVSWTAVAGNLVVTGSIHKHNTPHSGVIEGVVNATPNPTSGSCFNKLQKNFILTGNVAFEMISGV